MTARRTAALAAAASLLVLAPATVAVPPAAAVPVTDCRVKPGGTVGDSWAQRRLDVARAWSITQGQGVVVGVVDSGVNPGEQPQLAAADIRPGVNLSGDGRSRTSTIDCAGNGHGTAVTSIIAARPTSATDFAGVAPQVTIVPVKVASGDQGTSSDLVGQGIRAAVDAGARVVNVSVAGPTLTPGLEQAVADAARRDVLIVAAAGNDGANQNLPAYPAALSTRYPNVVAVSASDAKDEIAPFSETGDYVTVAAPGVAVPACAGKTGYQLATGTSFAAPFVTGTAALVRQAHPRMTAAQVRARLEATADAPPASVPDRAYGYGIVNPYLAVTSVRDDAVAAPDTGRGAPLPAAVVPPAADRTVQHRALAAAAVLLGLAALAVVAALVLRRRPRRPFA